MTKIIQEQAISKAFETGEKQGGGVISQNPSAQTSQHSGSSGWWQISDDKVKIKEDVMTQVTSYIKKKKKKKIQIGLKMLQTAGKAAKLGSRVGSEVLK